jgi:predicted nucleic acid-binding protein
MTREQVVVDASVVVGLLIDPTVRGDEIAARLASTQLHAPDHVLVEVTNVLRRMRNDRSLSEAEARLAVDALDSLTIQLWPWEVVATRTWQLGNNYSSYDAAYVALAEHLGSSLLTSDARLGRAPGAMCTVEVFV